MGRHIDHETLMLWVRLVQAGDYHTPRQIREVWYPNLTTHEVRDMLERLTANRMVRQKREACKHTVYGVTTLCIAPPGYAHMMQPAGRQGAAA